MKRMYGIWARLVLILVLGCCNSESAFADDLKLTNGTVYKNVTVTKADPDGLRIIHSDGGGKVLFADLPEEIQKKYNYDPVAAQQYTAQQEAQKRAALEKVLKQAAATPPPTATTSTSTATSTGSSPVAVAEAKPPARKLTFDAIYSMAKGNLDCVEDGKLVRFDESKLNPVQFYAIYYSAHWCGPCRAFTPELVSFYNEFKPKHPEFEIIFVSCDQTEAGMLTYMKEASMPWPAAHFSSVDRQPEGWVDHSGMGKYAGNGIPCLVLIDASSGSVMSDSYERGRYLGPHKVLADIKKMVR